LNEQKSLREGKSSRGKQSNLKVKAVGITHNGTAQFYGRLTPEKQKELERTERFSYDNRQVKFIDNSHLPIIKKRTMYDDEEKNRYIK